MKFSSIYYWLTSLTIIVYNSFFYMFTYPIIGLIGYHLKTDLTKQVSYTIFMCLCVDMILLPILIGANSIEYGSNLF